MRAVCLVCAVVLLTAATGAAQSAPSRDHLEALRHLRLGQENMHAEQWDKAEAEFRAAVKLEPSLEMGHYGLGQVYMATKRFSEAVSAYLACRDAFTANTARRAGNDIEAQRALDDEIRALEDEKALLVSGRVKAMMSSGPIDLDRRIADLKARRFRDATGVPDIPAWISIALGSAHFRSGAMPDAEREYLAAIKADPKLGEAHNNLAVVYMLTQRYAEANAEVKAAEKSGFRVNPQLKEDLKKASARH
jgi:tetratricopeptide (TPR) repeat protein